jgi:DNA-binding ferritin-like protein
MPTIKVVKLYQEQPVYDPTIVIKLALECSAQLKLFHWQTFSFAQHEAFDKIGKDLAKAFDSLVETLLGRYRQYEYKPLNFEILPHSNETVLVKINQYLQILTGQPCALLDPKDSDAQNIVEEIVADLNKLKYLLTLE